MLTVEDLYREDVGDKITNVSRGREYRGPCPSCGGDDRFGVYPEQNGGEGSFYCGRGKGVGNGCGKGGDIIQYLRDFRNMSYPEACRFLGKEPKGGGAGYMKYSAPRIPRTEKSSEFIPEKKQHPDTVVDPAKWREHAEKFVNACHEALLSRPTSIAYLMTRGIPLESIKKFRLGFHAGETRKDLAYQPSFRPWPSWGLANEKNTKGRTRMLMLPAGIVSPYFVDGKLHRIAIRLIKPDPRQPRKKYHYVVGSIRDLWLTNPTAKAFVVQEAEFDCMAVAAAAGDLVGTIGIGSTGVRPDKRCAAALKSSICILGSLDFDSPRYNQQTGKNERPGAKGSEWWAKTYPHYTRWPVPSGKDAGEAFENGVDLRTWVLAGLPASMRTGVASRVTGGAQSASDLFLEEELAEEARIKRMLNEKKFPPASDVQELKDLLYASSGFVHIHGRGLNLGLKVSEEWVVDNQDLRRRMTDLVYRSKPVAAMLGNLPDGLYSASSLPV